MPHAENMYIYMIVYGAHPKDVAYAGKLDMALEKLLKFSNSTNNNFKPFISVYKKHDDVFTKQETLFSVDILRMRQLQSKGHDTVELLKRECILIINSECICHG